MAIPIDARRRTRFGGRGRSVGLTVVVAFVVLALSLKGIATFYTDFLWFRSLGQTSVWRKVLGAQAVLALLFIALFFVLCWVNLVVADRLAPRRRPAGPEEELLEAWHNFVDRRARLVRIGVAGMLAGIAGAGVSSQWNEWLLFTNAVDFGQKDPLFGKDIGFYVFRLPFLSFLTNWLFFSFVMILLITAVQHYLNGGIRLQVERDYVTPQVKAHLSLLLGVLALVKAADYWLQRYELVLSQRGVIDGATYTDVNVQRPAIYLLLMISVLSFGLLVFNIFRRGWQLPAVTVGLWAFSAIAAGSVYPAFVQRFQVEPAQSTKEREFVERNIIATRAAYGLDKVERRSFEYRAEPNSEELAASVETISNVRLVTPERVETTLNALQGAKDFYKFHTPDLDRYVIDGKPTQVVIGVRELNENSENGWENAHLAYTHGDGVVVAQADVLQSGVPEFLVSGLPPEVDPSIDLRIDRSQVYFGENLGGYAIINTKRNEIGIDSRSGATVDVRFADIAQGETTGVEMGSLVRRAAFALRFSRIDPLISNFITDDSRVIFKRDVRERVKTIAPFLRFDSDPYPVIADGRMVYVIDAYTTTANYPYAQRVSGLQGGNDLHGINYVRNSVKAVVDAFDGSMTFYAMPGDDPLLAAYSKAFPGLFTPFDEMPGSLKDHLRYPTDLFDVQSAMWARYHVDDPVRLLERSEQWKVADTPGTQPQVSTPTTGAAGTGGGATVTSTNRPMPPMYTQVALPGESDQSFVITRSFSPQATSNNRPTLTGVMYGMSDPGEYGKLVVYNMSGPTPPDAPFGVQTRISSSSEVSQAITLLSQRGSKVFYGDLMMLPVGKSFVNVRPLYVQPEEERTAATVEKIIVQVGDRAVMADSLAGALDAAFPGTGIGTRVASGAGPSTTGGGTGGGGAGGSGGSTTPLPAATGEQLARLLAQISEKRTLANQRFGEGKFAEFATLQSDIDKLIAEAQKLLGATPAAPPTTTAAGGSSPGTAPATSTAPAPPTTTAAPSSTTSAPTTTVRRASA
jgi:uncharacterized membrane protein (UPF0182 family)